MWKISHYDTFASMKRFVSCHRTKKEAVAALREFAKMMHMHHTLTLAGTSCGKDDKWTVERVTDLNPIPNNWTIQKANCLSRILAEAGWRSKSHTVNELLQALVDGERICRLDSGSSGEDDLLIGTEHEVDCDVCAHFDLEEIPEDWKITDVTGFLEWNMWYAV